MMKRILGVLLLVGYFVSVGVAQVSISPTTIFIGQDRFSSFTVINNSPNAQEVSIEFLNVVPTLADSGNTRNMQLEEALDARFLMGDWLRAFPRTFLLQAGQRQTVRLTLRPDSNIQDGVYFKRVSIKSNPQTAEVGTSSTTGIGTQINIIFDQVLSVVYRTGTVRASFALNGEPEVYTDENGYRIIAPVALTGNSFFIGTIQTTLRKNNEVVHESIVRTSQFANGKRPIGIPRSEAITPGEYQLELLFTNDRPDIPAANRIPMEPFRLQFPVTLP